MDAAGGAVEVASEGGARALKLRPLVGRADPGRIITYLRFLDEIWAGGCASGGGGAAAGSGGGGCCGGTINGGSGGAAREAIDQRRLLLRG